MRDVGVDCAAILRRSRGGLHRSRGTRVDGTRRDVVGVDVAVGRALGSVSSTDAKTEGGGGAKSMVFMIFSPESGALVLRGAPFSSIASIAMVGRWGLRLCGIIDRFVI